ncbi:MAG: response regulator [Anaerolineales bacterium]|nr:response regulator [Anaerolineales bacterium]
MPSMDGYALLGVIRSRPTVQSVPVIALTANAMIGDEDSIRNAGVDGYIGKPFSLITFVKEITEVVTQLDTAGT